MNAHAGLLDAIRADPDADEPRLILADWLEDHDQPARGELIRLQVLLARLPEWHAARPEVEARVRGLLLLGQADWVGSPAGQWEFRRGFAEGLTVPSRLLLQRPDDYLGGQTVRELAVLLARNDDLESLAREPGLRGVRSLSIRGGRLPTRGLDALHDSPHTAGVVELKLHFDQITRRGVRVLRRWVGRLRALDLSRCRIDPTDLRGLLPASASPLERLRLDENPLAADALDALFACANLPNLRDLSLAGVRLRPEGVGQLRRAVFAARLESLDLSRSDAIDACPIAFDGRAFPSLRRLVLHYAGFDWGRPPPPGAGVAASLRHLELGLNDHIPADLPRWLEQPVVSGLRSLHLLGDLIRGESDSSALCRALASSPALADVRTLSLTRMQVGDNLSSLLAGRNADGWRSLALDEEFFPDGIQAHLAGGFGGGLVSLALDRCYLYDSDAAALAFKPELAGMRRLSLAGNHIRDDGATALAGSPVLRDLTALDLSDNAINDAAIFADGPLANPAVLDLGDNPIRAGGEELLRAGAEWMRRPVTLPILELLREVTR